MLHARHSRLHISRFKLRIRRSTICTPHAALHDLHPRSYTCITFCILNHALHALTVHAPTSRLTFCILRGMLYTSHPAFQALYTQHPALHTPHSTLYAPNSTPYAPDSAPHPTLKIPHSKFQPPQSAISTAFRTASILYALRCALHTRHLAFDTLHASPTR